ncbi:MAG: hypothetical protein JNK16_07660 [Phycisphaerales bacterium]|nr:hypothetical protein [Phycisphaerales bacterium]
MKQMPKSVRVTGICAGVGLLWVCIAARASLSVDQPSSERIAAVREQLVEEERWVTFIRRMYGVTQSTKALEWPKEITTRMTTLYADADMLEAELRILPDKTAALAKAEAKLPALKAERLSLIRDIYKDVLKELNVERSTRLFQEGGGKEVK